MIYPLRDYARAWYRGAEMASMFVAGDKVWDKFVQFSPLSLFANGEHGAWFDPSDLTTMFQDTAGTIPAGFGEPVGLILDKSQGLTRGPELVTNGDFSQGSTGWTLLGAATINDGRGSTVSGGGWRTSVALVAGRSYEVRFSITRYVIGSVTPVFTSGTGVSGQAKSGIGDYRQIFTANAGNNGLQFSTGGGSNLDIDNISVRELPGNHARQATATARPTLMQSGAAPYLYRDPVDDAIPWTAPAGSYDIVHISLTGPATVLTAQALSGATNILLADNTRAYLAIDRRLTGAEINALAAYYGASA